MGKSNINSVISSGYSSNSNSSGSSDIETILRSLSNENTAKTFAFNSSEAQKERDWSEKMSKTSHQIEVEDLKRAGLNPVLSANSGASSYSGASASGQSDNSAVGVIASLYQTKMNNDNAIKLAKLQNENNREIAKIQAAASNYAANTSASASRYGASLGFQGIQYSSDRSKYGLVGNFIDGVTGNNSSNNSASKFGNYISSGVSRSNQPWYRVFGQLRRKYFKK